MGPSGRIPENGPGNTARLGEGPGDAVTTPTVRAAQTTEMPGVWTPRSKRGQDWCLPKAVRVPGVSRLLQVSVAPCRQPPSVSSQHLRSVCLCVQMSPLYMDSSHTGLGPSLVTSSYVDHLQRPYFHVRSHPQVLQVRTAASFGDTVQPLAWGKVREAAGPPVEGELSPVPPRMSLLCCGYFPSPTNPAPRASLPPPLPHASINLHLVLRAGNVTSNPSCCFNFYIRTWQDGRIFLPVLRWADSRGHVARENTNDSEPLLPASGRHSVILHPSPSGQAQP